MTMQSLFLAPVILALAAMSWAQVSAPANSPDQATSAQAQSSAAPADALAPETLLPVELSKALDAHKIKINDRIEARTATDLLAHGQIVVPRNTRIIGHVTEAKAHTKSSPDSKVGITFDRMLLKDGREVPLQLSVQAIARPLQYGYSPEGNLPRADRPAGMSTAPGQRGPIGDASNSGPPSSFPGDLAPIPDPMAPNGSGISTSVPLSPTSKGVIGIKGLALDTSGSVAVLSSNTANVRLDAGTQLILRVQ